MNQQDSILSSKSGQNVINLPTNTVNLPTNAINLPTNNINSKPIKKLIDQNSENINDNPNNKGINNFRQSMKISNSSKCIKNDDQNGRSYEKKLSYLQLPKINSEIQNILCEDYENLSQRLWQQNQRRSQVALSELNQSLSRLHIKQSQLIKDRNQLKVELKKLSQLNKQYKLNNKKQQNQINKTNKKVQSMQKQRIELISINSQYKSQLQQKQRILNIKQQKIEQLQRNNIKIIDQLNFVTQLKNDLQSQNLQIKYELKKYEMDLKQITQNMQINGDIEANNIVIGSKIIDLQKQINTLKYCILELQHKQRYNVEQYRQLNKLLQSKHQQIMDHHHNITQLQTQLTIYKQLHNQTHNHKIRNQKHIQMLNFKQKQISALKKQIIQLKGKLKISSCYNSDPNQPNTPKLPVLKTPSQYITKLIKQHDEQRATMQKNNQLMENQLNKIKGMYQQQLSISINKNSEIDKLTLLINDLRNRSDWILNDQRNIMKKQKQTAVRQIDKLSQKVSSMKQQILQKDRIIMKYVQNQKNIQ